MVLSIAQGQAPSLKVGTLPAPIGGVQSTENLARMPQENCLYTYNLLPSQYGMEVRDGFQEWETGVGDTGNGLEVRTLIPFVGPSEDGSDNALFAVTEDGIYDVTSSGDAPTVLLAFPSIQPNSGYGVFASITNTAGVVYTFYADAYHGLYRYDSSGAAWSKLSGVVTGLTEANVRYVTVHMNRVWFVEQDSPDAFYLATGAISGAATKFYFGHQFKSGGDLVALVSWTMDGGRGLDDHLVAVGRGGDVIIYQGTDPSSATTWGIVGSWQIGRVPSGRRCVSQFGGNVYILCSQGLLDLKSIASGTDLTQAGARGPSAPISRVLRSHLSTTMDSDLWAIVLDSVNGAIVVVAPITASGYNIQYVMDALTQSWGFWRGMPMLCFAVYNSEIYWGDALGVVQKMTGVFDGTLLDGTPGEPIEFSILTAYSNLDEPGVNKIVQFIRPDYIAGGVQAYTIKALYDYDLDEILNIATPVSAGSDTWDSGSWDVMVWGGGRQGYSGVTPTRGMGRSVAIAMRGDSISPTTLVSWDVMYTSGGPM